jgi:asparagine synthase (glutamine-hydrolysing)
MSGKFAKLETKMIALQVNWCNADIDSTSAQRLAAALALGTNYTPHFRVANELVLATAKRSRRWEVSRTPRGEAVLFVGHIQNRRQLCRKLSENYPDDCALYAAAYAAWGDAADLEIKGSFATILHMRGEKKVRISRSPIEAPPLHIWRDARKLIVASTPHAIFATGEVERKLDEQKIADTLFLNYYDAERSWFQGVNRLPVGSRAIVTPDQITVTRYYDLSDVPDIRLARDEDYPAAASALLEEGTRVAMENSSNPAVMLSGGYDSQALAAYAVDIRQGGNVVGFTSVPEGGWDRRTPENQFGDERDHVMAFAAMYPAFERELVDAKGLSFDHQLEAMFLLGNASPRNGLNFFWIHEILARAKKRGCDVILSGEGGNATFSFAGEGALATWFQQGRWASLLRELKALGRERSALRVFASEVVLPLVPDPIWKSIMFLRHGRAPSFYESWSPLNPAWAAEMRVEERAREMGYDFLYRPFKSSREWRVAALSDFSNEGGDIIQAFELRHGLPIRFPTMYRPLLEFCMGIPDDQYLRDGQRRWLAKRMLRGRVPDIVLKENRLGRQGSDWHLRLGRQLESLKSEIQQLSRDPDMTRRLNFRVLGQALEHWPAVTPVGSPAADLLNHALVRGLTTARFIRYIEGKNI